MHGKSQNLMTEGSIGLHLLRFALPLFVGDLFQQLYNTADSVLVGRLIGSGALAAVSATSNLVFLMVSFFEGLSAGAGVVISQFFGAGDDERMSKAVHTNFTLGLGMGAFLTVFGMLMSPVILRWMGTPAEVMGEAVSYIRIYFAGGLALVMYNACRGIMQAVGDSTHPLYYLILSSVLNVVLDILFIAGFHSGVGGAALATVISQFVSVVLCVVRLMRTREGHRIRLRSLSVDRTMLRVILRYGVPSGLQSSVIGIANVVVQSYINAFGTAAVAGCGAYSRIEGFAFLPINSLNIGLTTFVGQNLGAREHGRAKKGAAIGILSCVAIAELIGLLVYTLSPTLLRAFTDDPQSIAFGVQKAHTCALFYCLLASTHCLASVLRGAGKAVVPMATMLAVWCVFRVSFLVVLTPVFRSIGVVNWVYPVTWFISTVFLGIYFFRADWLHAFERARERFD